MSLRINGEEVEGVVGYLIAIPFIVLTFLWLALVFLATALVILSPLILVVLGIIFLIHH